MKKILVALCICFFSSSFAADIFGKYENSSRVVEFTEDSLLISLKTFYGLHSEEPRKLDATVEENNSGYELITNFVRQNKVEITPFMLWEDKIFLDYCVRGSAFSPSDTSTGAIDGFFRPAGNKSGFEFGPSVEKEELTGYYFTKDKVFVIRYWKATVPYETTQAVIPFGEELLPVDKFLDVGGTVYTCVHGAGTEIRNIKHWDFSSKNKNFSINGKSLGFFNEDFSAILLGKPYLTKSE